MMLNLDNSELPQTDSHLLYHCCLLFLWREFTF